MMENDNASFKSLLPWFFFGLMIVFASYLISGRDSRTKIVFCDVGQGNAAYLRIDDRLDLLVDAGPDRSVLHCLGRHMPFYDRRLELVIITHSDSDHYGGLFHLIGRYDIGQIVLNDLKKADRTFKNLKEKIVEEKIPLRKHYAGDRIKLADGLIYFHWPSVDFGSVSGNETSSVFSYSEKDFRLLFTGDSSPETLNRLKAQDISGTDILAVPHHGSKNGLTEKFLRLADPRLAVISVGKNNPFGHPHKSILELIRAKKINILRTDEEGDIKFILGESI